MEFLFCFHLSPWKQELFLTSKVNYLPTLLKPYSSEILTCISYLLGYNSDQYLILKLIYSENAPKLVEFLSCFHLSPLKQELFLTNKVNYSKFRYSQKATKFFKISTVDLTFTRYVGQIYGGDFTKICGLLRIYELC